MARTVKDAALGSRAARETLPTKSKPYYRSIMQGLHIGYYKGSRGGSWTARRFIGGTSYQEHKLGTADDIADADGVAVLSFNQAQEQARSWFTQRAMDDSGGITNEHRNSTVATAIEIYKSDYTRRGGKSLLRVTQAINAHILPALGEIQLSKLTRGKLESWLDNLVSTPARLRTRRGAIQRYRTTTQDNEGLRRRRATANRVLAILKAALNQAYQRQMVSSKNAWETLKPFREVSAPKIRYLTDPEIQRFINASPSPFRELVIGAILTGMRYGELAAMVVQDFDPEAGTIHVPVSKSGKPRHIYLTDEGVEFFVDHSLRLKGQDRMFQRTNKEPWGESHQFRWVQDACCAARIEPAVGFHILRHTYASRLAMKGVPLNVIAAQLGHADSRMTEKHYAHLAPSYISEVVRAAFGRIGMPITLHLA